MNNKKETKSEYLKKLNVVFEYIENNLDKKLTIKKISEISNLSEFHFHRIFKGLIGENIGNYIIRKRVETSAHLIRYTGLEIKEIAFNVGYDNPSSLNKLFKQYYNVSPSVFRKNKRLFVRPSDLQNTEIDLGSPKISTLAEKQVIYITITGAYGNPNYKKVWADLWHFAQSQSIITNKTERIGISHNDPKITENKRCKYDACLTIETQITPQKRIGTKTIKGGKYAIFTYIGAYGSLGMVYDEIFGAWLPNSNHRLRNVPVFEKKVNALPETNISNLITEIYLPIK